MTHQTESDFRNGTWKIENGKLARHFRIENGCLRTEAIHHGRSGKTTAVDGPEFVLIGQEGRIDSDAFAVVRAPRVDEEKITFELESSQGAWPVGVTVAYSLKKDDVVVRKTISIRNRADAPPVAIEEVHVESLGLRELKAELAEGIGQPVFAGEWFLGVEHPVFWPHCVRDVVVLAVVPATVLTPGRELVLPAAILGAGSVGNPLEGFHRYLDTIRAQKAHVFTLMNTWFHSPQPTEELCTGLLQELHERWIKPHPGVLDAFVLDDGWDDLKNLWFTHDDRFPRGLGPVAAAAKKSGLRFGLWCSPWGGYPSLRSERSRTGAQQGFGTVDDTPNDENFLCLGERKYFRYYQDRLFDLLLTHQITFFKFDGFPHICNNPRHGHPTGRGSITWNANRMIEIAGFLRDHCPEIFLLATIGFWQSPWWLMYVDAVYIGGADFGTWGEGSERQRDMTFRDQCIHAQIVKNRSRMPLSAAGIHGITKASFDSGQLRNFFPDLFFGDESLEEWESVVWTNVGRGVGMVETYISPASLSGEHYRVLSEAITYLRKNWEVLRQSRWWGGDPGVGEAYGLRHEAGGRMILFARNPSGREQSLEMPPGSFSDVKTVGAVSMRDGRIVLGPFAMTLRESAS